MHTSEGNVTSEYPKQIKTNKSKIKENLFLEGIISCVVFWLSHSSMIGMGREGEVITTR